MTDRELIILGLCSPPYVSVQDEAWEGLPGAVSLYLEFRRELAACLPPEQERTLRRGKPAVQLVQEQAPLSEPERSPWRNWIVFGLVAAGIAAFLLLAGCSKPRLPPPGVEPTLIMLERIEGRILTHELTTARWRGAR